MKYKKKRNVLKNKKLRLPVIPAVMLILAVFLLLSLKPKDSIAGNSHSINAIRWRNVNETTFSKEFPSNPGIANDNKAQTSFPEKNTILEDELLSTPPNPSHNDPLPKDVLMDKDIKDDIHMMQPNEDIQPQIPLHNETKLIAIDAGHQKQGNYDKEPIGPGAEIMKAKVSSGTKGIVTGIAEYELNLTVSKKLNQELINRGYEVYMIRKSHDVNLSNRERAILAKESNADIFLRIHANGSENKKANGACTIYPSKNNSYVSYLSDESKILSEAVIQGICESTGAKNNGAVTRDDMSGINWSSIPVTIIEMGYMTNPKEDRLLQTESYQDKIVEGICNGIDQYYEALAE